ncbi:MAG: hypothetical protein IPM24_07370 [Bryobacterales bacterium]|nr:hypothetical protein [Bryobacterales bacterium]
MTRREWVGLTAASAAVQAPAQNAIPIGTERQLFADRFLIDRLTGTHRLHAPRDAGPVFRFDAPWEGIYSAYATVVPARDRLRLYYRGNPAGDRNRNQHEVTCVAESADGIHWERPRLDLYPGKPNVVLAEQPPCSHNFAPFIDEREGVPASERWKALAGTGRGGLMAYASPDGYRWRRMRDEAVVPWRQGAGFDSLNIAFWSANENQYVCYFRSFRMVGGERYRWIARTTSPDFLNWAPPLDLDFRHHGEPAPPEQLYTNQIAPYYRAPSLYLGIAARFFPNRPALTPEQQKGVNVEERYLNDISDAVLLTTRAGIVCHRDFLEGFVRPGIGYDNWTSRTNYPVRNVVPTSETELSLYVQKNYGQPTGYLRRYTLRIDGFASVGAGYGGGDVVTKPVVFSGKQLEINYATSAAGGVRVELTDTAGKPLPGFAAGDCREIIGDEIARTVVWSQGSDVSRAAGTAVRLRFVLKDADVYSFRFIG